MHPANKFLIALTLFALAVVLGTAVFKHEVNVEDYNPPAKMERECSEEI